MAKTIGWLEGAALEGHRETESKSATTPNDAARPVKQFDFCPSHRYGGDMEESETGDYVLFADYEATQGALVNWQTKAAVLCEELTAMHTEVQMLREHRDSLNRTARQQMARADAAEATLAETRKHLNFAMFSSNPQEIHDRVLAACTALNEGGE